MNGGTIRQFFLLLLGLTYIGIGVYIFWKKVIDTPWSEIMAVVFIAYGSWRSYRAIMKE